MKKYETLYLTEAEEIMEILDNNNISYIFSENDRPFFTASIIITDDDFEKLPEKIKGILGGQFETISD